MNRNIVVRIFIILAAAVLISLSGCKDFSFFTELGSKGSVRVSPSTISVMVGSSVTFSASGGTAPYTFAMVSGSGTIDPATGLYSAPAAQSTDIVMATDSIGQSATATVTVVDALEELKISPTSAGVSVSNSISFVATGGVGPYTYSIQTNNSGGSIVPDTGEYTAGSTTGVSDTIIVTDSDSPAQTCSVPAVVSVSAAATNVDYSISADTFSTTALVGEILSGEFTIANGGSATGTADISWWLFISADGSFGGDGEDLVASGSVTDDIPASGTHVVTPTGNWPADLSPGSYRLFVMISSPDDLNHGNNVYDAGAFDLTVPDVDYRVTSVSVTGGYLHVGAAMSGEFILDNEGTDDGSQPVTWKVYVSTNTAVDVGDTLIDSFNAEGAMNAADSPRTISFGGTWPTSTGNYYLIVEVSAADDEAAGNSGDNTTATVSDYAIDYPDVDYQVLSVSHITGTRAGGSVDGEFVLDNTGADDGSSTVNWKVYASTNTTLDVGDALVDWSTTEPAMGASDTARTIAFSGTWPMEPGWYYLVAEVSAFDETQAGNDYNNETASASMADVVVGDVDYYAGGISASAGAAGGPLSCTFDLSNAGTDASALTITWNLYASVNTTLDAGDYLAAYGTAGPLGAVPDTTAITPGAATWPAVPGDYYLIVEIESLEDIAAGATATANDVAVSSSTFNAAAPDVNYAVNTVTFVSAGSTYLPDGAVNGNFQYINNGSSDGTQPVSWEAYASLDTNLDAGDSLVDSGTGLAALASGPPGSGSISFSGKWPLDYGDYYLLVRVMSSEEVDPLDNVGATGATEAVGYFDESLNEPNDDYTTLTDFYDLGLTFKPGMSIEVTGTMSSTDIDDIIAFNTGLCTMITFAVTYGPSSPSGAYIRIFLMDGPNSFIDGVSGTTDAISLNWLVDATNSKRYLNIDNRGEAQIPPPSTYKYYDGTYTCVITGH